MKRLYLISLTLLFSLTLLIAKQPDGRTEPGNIKVPSDVVYEVRNYRDSIPERAGQVGIAYPKYNQEILPMIIFIHGGGWKKGDKDQVAWMSIAYAQRGYVTATISYRLTGESPYPAAIEDVKEAIRYMKSIAGEINVDINKIGLWGYSAGGHLALLAGLSGKENVFTTDAYSEYDSSVACIFSVAGPTDMITWRKDRMVSFLTEEQNQNEDFIKMTSPISYINKNQIPVFLYHGSADNVVPEYHYKNFVKASKKDKVKNLEYEMFPDGNHMFYFKNKKAFGEPTESFFEKHLK